MVLKFYSNIFELYPVDRYIPCQDDYKNHKDIPALPFSRSTNNVARPKPESYPNALKTIGDHIRAWRLDNHLLQADVAKILSVCEDTIVGWEMRGIVPTIRQMPGIINMIKYLPIQIDTSSFGGRITHYRYTNGLTPKEFGTLISANASTIRDWEKGKHIPPKNKQVKIDAILINRLSIYGSTIST